MPGFHMAAGDLNSSPRADAATIYQLNHLPNPVFILRQVFTKSPGQGHPALISQVAGVTCLSIFLLVSCRQKEGHGSDRPQVLPLLSLVTVLLAS